MVAALLALFAICSVRAAPLPREIQLEARVTALVASMSNAEKARQLDMYSGKDFLTDGKFNATKADLLLSGGLGIGRIHDLYAQVPSF